LNNPLRYTDPSGHMYDPDVGLPGTWKPEPAVPPARYLHSEQYGWFDKSHFSVRQAGDIIKKVERLASEGGGRFWVEGGQGGSAGGVSASFRYKREYWVSGDVTSNQVRGVTLGIYMDYHHHFERWQGEWGDPTSSSFAIEDHPSEYIGFYSAATGMTLGQIFVGYLGGVEGRQQDPPRHQKNYGSTPVLCDKSGYVIAPWPDGLVITPIGRDSGLWDNTGAERAGIRVSGTAGFVEVSWRYIVHGPVVSTY